MLNWLLTRFRPGLKDPTVFAINRSLAPFKLHAFLSKHAAVAACPGMDVAEGDWDFFAADGSPLKPVYSTPARMNPEKNTFTHGVYSLENGDGSNLLSQMNTLEMAQGGAFKTLAEVSAHVRSLRK